MSRATPAATAAQHGRGTQPEGIQWDARALQALRHLDDLIAPGAPSDTEHSEGARFFVRGWLLTVAFTVTLSLSFWSEGMLGQTLLNGLVAVVGVVMLTLARLGRDRRGLVHITLTVPMWAVAAGSLAQTPFDLSSVFYLPLFPLLASIMGTGWMLFYLAQALLVGLAAITLGLNGVTFSDVDPHPSLTMMTNYGFVALMTGLAGMSLHELRRRAVASVQAASRAKSAFLANMSHEIRTPMNGVLGLTELMLTEPLPPVARERLELIRRSGEVLVALINDLLDLSRIEAGKMTVTPVDVELAPLLQDMRRLFESTAQAKGLAMTLDCDRALPTAVRVDPMRLRQILSNLLNNAVKFTDRGAVHLIARPVGTRIHFEVADTGIGIPEAQIGSLFQSYHQAEQSSARRGGTGLGLALSRHLVHLMGGELSVASQRGVGSRFFFELELPEAAVPTRAPPHQERTRKGGRILVVDDNPINLKVARGLAEKAGYAVTTANNGLEAVAAVEREAFDAVLMDCLMPELDGYEATRRIRALPAPRSLTRIIALTASALPDDVAACFAAGMNGFVSKPVTLERMLEALEEEAIHPPSKHDATAPETHPETKREAAQPTTADSAAGGIRRGRRRPTE